MAGGILMSIDAVDMASAVAATDMAKDNHALAVLKLAMVYAMMVWRKVAEFMGRRTKNRERIEASVCLKRAGMLCHLTFIKA